MKKKFTMLFAALLACVGVMAQWGGSDYAVSAVSTTPATSLSDGYYVIYNNGRGTFMNAEAALGEAKMTWPVTASASGLDAFNNGEALTNQGAQSREAYVFYLTLEDNGKLSLMTCYGDYVPALTSNTTFNYTVEKGLWNYNFKVEGGESYLFMWSDNGTGLDANGWDANSHTYSTVAGWNADANQNISGNQSWTLYEATMSSAADVVRATLASLKDAAKDKIDELIALPGTEPVGEVVSALSAAIASATANEGSDDMDVLAAAIQNLQEAIAMTKNLEFEGGALATLDEDLYVIYYEDANGDRHYLVNNKNTRRVVTSSVAAVYDVYDGNTDGGYAPFAYFLDMNESKISNPTSGDDKEIQVENKGGNNYGNDRQWDSQVLYVDANGKYAIRSTNCTTGSGWNSDCFITVSYDGTTVYGENTDLSDALYVWNVVKASEADIAFELEVDEYKYMTLFLNYAVIVPSGAKAYAVSAVENSQLVLTEVEEGIIPMNTPVIIEAEQGDYRFVYTDPIGTYEGENLLKGSWLDSYVAPAAGTDAYVMTLSASGEAVMGKAMLNVNANGEAGTTHFMNRANKAYLEIETAKAAGAAMYSFNRGEGTTSIEDVELTNDNVVIYDITGRRVEKMEKGIYIVNGKKVLVK